MLENLPFSEIFWWKREYSGREVRWQTFLVSWKSDVVVTISPERIRDSRENVWWTNLIKQTFLWCMPTNVTDNSPRRHLPLGWAYLCFLFLITAKKMIKTFTKWLFVRVFTGVSVRTGVPHGRFCSYGCWYFCHLKKSSFYCWSHFW